MNLGNDKWQNTQGKLGSSSTGRGEAPETRGRELESLLATTEYESPTDTVVVRAVLGSQLSRTAVYGPVRTVVWQGSAGDRRPYADQTPLRRGSLGWRLPCGRRFGVDMVTSADEPERPAVYLNQP